MVPGPKRRITVEASDYNRIFEALKLYSRVHPTLTGYKEALARWESYK